MVTALPLTLDPTRGTRCLQLLRRASSGGLGSTALKLLIQPADGIAPLVAAIKNAKKSVSIVIFRFDRAELEAGLKAAVGRGVFGIPTYFVGGEMFFGKDRLGQVEEAAQAAA